MKQVYRGGSTNGVQRGFALPTILIASVVMLIVLLAAVQTVVAARLGIQEQYYSQLASEAAESGLIAAEACIKANTAYEAAWSGGTLDTGDNCSGSAIGGAPTTVLVQADPVKLDTSYSVAYPDNTKNPVIIEAVGTVSLKRKSDNSEWKTYTMSRKMSLSRGVKAASQFSSGSGFSCAIFDGETWCFGENKHGVLGTGQCHSWDMLPATVPTTCNGTLDVSLVPLKIVRESGVLAGKTDKLVAAGNYAACVVATDDDGNDGVYCWGYNLRGQLGRGTTANYDGLVPATVDMSLLSGKTITDIEVGTFRTCIVASGDVYCWGLGDWGGLGRGGATPNAHSGSPIKVQDIGTTASPNSREVIDIGTTPDLASTCAVISQSAANNPGRVYCWGRNQRGQLGDGTTIDRPTPVLVSGLTSAISVTGGGGVTKDGGSTVDLSSAGVPLGTDSGTLTNAGRITKAHFCAVTSAKKLYCWGANQYGQLGIGLSIASGQSVAPNASRSLVPMIPDRPLSGTGVSMNSASVQVERVATSVGSTCALLGAPSNLAGTVWCIGQNDFAIGRNGMKSNSEIPVNDTGTIIKNNFYPMLLPTGGAVPAIFGASNRMCAIVDDRLYCVGNNAIGQLGLGWAGNTIDGIPGGTPLTAPMEAKILRQFDTFQLY